MKKIVLILSVVMIAILCICIAGCTAEDNEDFNEDLVVISENVDFDCPHMIFYHKRTKVMYLFVKVGYAGGLTVMLDENGNPLLYEEGYQKKEEAINAADD